MNDPSGFLSAPSAPDAPLTSIASSLRSLLDALGVITWEADPVTARLIRVDGAIERLLGHAPAAWLAPGFRERLVHPDDRAWVVARWHQQRLSADDDAFDYRAIAADGRCVWLRERLSVVPATERESAGLRGVLVDVTREKLVERELREQRDLNAAVQDDVDAYVVVLDAAGRVLRVNRACERALGTRGPGAAGRPFADTFAPATARGAVESALAAASAGRGRMPIELEWFPGEDGPHGVAWTFAPLRDSDDRPILVATGVDVTERQRITRELRVYEEALRRSAGLEPFGRRVARIAHDYNNALTGLLGFADMLAVALRGQDRAIVHVNELRAAAERVADLTTQLRALAAEAVPPADAPPAAVASVPAAPAAGTGAPAAGRLVLLVEDEDIVRRLMIETLRREGWRVLDAPSAAEALRIAREEGTRLDLLVTDIVMPGMSGRELAERLRRAQPELPVLFVTGFTSEADPRRLPGRSAALLQKPFLPEGLASKVRELLQACVD